MVEGDYTARKVVKTTFHINFLPQNSSFRLSLKLNHNQ